MKILWIFFICAAVGCTNSNSQEQVYSLDLDITANGFVVIERINPISEYDLDLAMLVNQVGLYQIELKNQTKSALYGLPDLYMSYPNTYNFILKANFKVDSVKLYKMDGSSGHFTLKNQPSIQSIKVTN